VHHARHFISTVESNPCYFLGVNNEPSPMNRFIELSAIVLLGSIASMIASVLLLDALDHFPAHLGGFTSGKEVLEHIAFWSVVVFGVCAAIIWFYGLAWFWKNMPHHSFSRNAALLFLLVGFSWLAGLVIYFRERKRCRKKLPEALCS
jgi:hypothetical protein